MAAGEGLYLIVGARGMLGRDLVDLLRKQGRRTVALARGDLDITDAAAVREAFCAHAPDVAINAAAFTNVDGCESETEAAYRVNALGPSNLAQAAQECGSFLVHVSTDYVFDGSKGAPYTETDALHPLGVYGKSKAEGEAMVASHLPGRHCIVRSQWLFGLHGKNFVEAILQAALTRNPLRVVNDQWGSPTCTIDLAKGILSLCDLRATGIVHVTNAGVTTWYDFAVRILRHAGMEHVEVQPISTSELGRPAPRPAYSVLDNARFRELAAVELRHWESALDEYLSLRGERNGAAT